MTPEASSITFAGPRGRLFGVYASPVAPRGAVLVIHENRGLTEHFHRLVTRLAGDGYAALAIDLASAAGGTYAIGEDAAREALAAAARPVLLADLGAGLGELARRHPNLRLGVIGFCFGGVLAWALVAEGDRRLGAVIACYGRAPADADFSRSAAAVFGVYAGNDEGVNATRAGAEAALEHAGLVHQIVTYDGAEHAFMNDTRPNHHPDQAAAAYADMLRWLATHLDGAPTV